MVVAIADGHGSSLHAEVGARLAVKVATEALLSFVEHLSAELRTDARAAHSFAQHPFRVQLVREWVERVRTNAGSESVALKDYGSTLVFVAVTPELVVFGQLGDGDILVVDGLSGVHRPIPADPTSFAEETLSLCLPEAWSGLRVLVTPLPERETLILISTDGYSKSYASDRDFDEIGPDYLSMVRELGLSGVQTHLDEFLSTVTREGSGDDVTLGLIYVPGPSPACPEETAAAPDASVEAVADGGDSEMTLMTPEGAETPQLPGEQP